MNTFAIINVIDEPSEDNGTNVWLTECGSLRSYEERAVFHTRDEAFEFLPRSRNGTVWAIVEMFGDNQNTVTVR